MKAIHDNISRRKFLSSGFMWFGLAFGLGALMARFVQFLLPESEPRKIQEVLVGVEADIPAGGLALDIAGEKVILLKKQDEVIAFSRRCTDLGCLVSWDRSAEQFICPCHHGIYDANGKNISGPPPRPLDRFEVKRRGDYVYVKIKRA
ncbi:MAG: Rieske (2Fe-2S) protein [Deltaproteobacteria bacterium]|nr:Rieske (2Fe-2S) protein [Deltaproteobacteria bacterium]